MIYYGTDVNFISDYLKNGCDLTEQLYMVHVHTFTRPFITVTDISIPSPHEVLRVKLTGTGAHLLIYKTLPIN